MKVLFLSELFYPHGGGAELATLLYAKLLNGTGVDVTVVTNRFSGESETFGTGKLRIYRYPLFEEATSIKYSMLKRFNVTFSNFVTRLMKEADVVYVPRFWYSAIPIAKLHKKPVVVHLHDHIPACPLSNLYNVYRDETCHGRKVFCSMPCIYAFERIQRRRLPETFFSLAFNSTLGAFWKKCVEASDAVICVSKAHLDIIARTNASLRSKLHMIYNPLPDIPCLDFRGDDFGYFGGPNYMKGFHILYEAVKRANNNGRRIDVHMTNFPAGLDLPSDDAKKSGFRLYGRLAEKTYERLYERLRCIVVPSIWQEPWSYVTVEALCRGRLVIASEIGAIPEVAKGCPGAFLFQTGNVRQLTDRLTCVRDMSREVATDFGIKNREVFHSMFNNEKTLTEFLHLISTVSSTS